MCNKTPHKHAELIKAWADGATIQFKNQVGDWLDRSKPTWDPRAEYRVKPEPKPDFTRMITISSVPMQSSANGFLVSSGVMFLEKLKKPSNNLKLTFDGETGKLKKAEVI